MRHPRPATLLSLLALLLAGSVQAQDLSLGQRRRDLPARKGPKALSGHDRADGRRDWDLYWFGGRPTPEYLDQKGRIAQAEGRRWAHTLPSPAGRPQMARGASTLGWVNLGPIANSTSTNFPDIDNGRPVAIVPHPTQPHTLFLATSGGGVFKCTNADPGSSTDWTWTAITDALPTAGGSGNLSLGAMAVSPADPDTLFLGLGDAFDAEGRGLYKSSDGGATWTAAVGLGNATRISSILPLDANRILVGTNAGLKISTDGGANFTAASGTLATGRIWTLQKLSATRLILSRESGGTGSIYYSTDAGGTWTAASISGLAPGRITLGASAGSATIAWGMCEDAVGGKVARGLLKTTDGGANWSFVAAPTAVGGLFQGEGGSMTSDGGQAWYNHGFAVDPNDVNKVFMGSNLALYRTTDGGGNWTQLTHWYGHRRVYAHADFHCSAWSIDGSTLFIGNDGGLMVVRDPYRTVIPDDGVNVYTKSVVGFIDNRRNKGLASHLIYNIGSTIAATPADSRHRITLGMQDNGTRVRQVDGTMEGSGIFDDQIGGDGFGTVIHPENGDWMLGSLYYTRIFKSTNGGASFSESSSGITESDNDALAPFEPKIALGAASEPNTVYTFVNSKIYKSQDFGSSWTAVNVVGLGGTIRNVSASRSNPKALAVADVNGKFYTTYDSGATWNGGQSSSAYSSYVWFDTENDQTLYGASVTLSATSSHLFRSTNGGASWAPIDVNNGFPFGIPVHVIQNQPGDSNLLYAGTDFGVYRSINGGASWERFGAGLPMVAVRDLYVAPDGSFVRAATYGRGVWEISTSAPTVSVVISPTGPITLNPSATATFKATVSNATVNTVNWTASSGSISPGSTAGDGTATTTYTAPAMVGTYSVTATSVEDSSRTAATTVHVYNPAAVTVTVTPGTKSLMTGGTQTFTAIANGTPSAGTFTWSASGGTITSAGAYTAPATAGTYTITATSSWNNTTGTATVTVKTLDLNGDGVVDTLDVLQLTKRYGSSASGDLSVADFDGDGDIDDTDLNQLLAAI